MKTPHHLSNSTIQSGTASDDSISDDTSILCIASPNQDRTLSVVTNNTDTSRTQFLRLFIIIATYFLSIQGASSQAVYLEDGLRYGQRNSMITPRMGALGLSYAGLADDIGALYVNPAGLTLLPFAEFSGSFQLHNFNSAVNHFGTNTSFTRTSNALGHIGLALPVRVGEAGNYTIAFAYSREADFLSGDSISGFNTATSLINSWVTRQRTGSLDGNPAFELQLADVVNGRFITPLRSNLQQNVGLRENGSINNISIGLGVDVTRSLSLGVSFITSFGNYSYQRFFQEVDNQNRFVRLDTRALTDIDFNRMQAVEFVDHGISGSRFIFGAQGRFGDNIRANASFTLPLGYTIREEVSNSYSATFDNGDRRFFNPNDPPIQTIRFTMPWVLNVGAAVNVASGLTLTGSAEVSDVSAIRAAGSGIDATGIQQAAASLLGIQLRAGAGVEYDIPNRPFVLRGSYSYIGSPYLQASAGGNANLLGVGAGYYLGSNSRIDIGYRATIRSFNNLLYDAGTYTSNQFINQVSVQYIVRF